MAGKDNATALKLYESILADASLPDAIRRGAAAGRISASGNGARSVLLGYLREPSGSHRTRRAHAGGGDLEGGQFTFTAADISEVCAVLPDCPTVRRCS